MARTRSASKGADVAAQGPVTRPTKRQAGSSKSRAQAVPIIMQQSTINGKVTKVTKTVKKNAITKGDWVLPHGMGSATTSNSKQGTKEQLAVAAGPPALKESTLKTTANIQAEDFPVPIDPPEKLVEGRLKGARSSVRANASHKPAAKQGDRNLEVAQATETVSNAVNSARTRTNTPSTLKKAIVVAKGIVVEDGLAVKVGDEIIFDASQFLDPEFKMRVVRGTENSYGLTVGHSPYPWRKTPTPEACEEVHSILTELHGKVAQPEKAPTPSLLVAGCGEVPSVLDALLRTLISGNTLMANADAAVKKLAKMYGILTTGIGAGSIDWDKVRTGTLEMAIAAVRPAGCAGTKAAHIKTILNMVYEENKSRAKAHIAASETGTTADIPGRNKETKRQKVLEVEKSKQHVLSLDHMHSMTKDQAMAEFLRFPGVGVKTAACVTLFCLRIPCYAVDTHVHKFSKWLGWVPGNATELDTYNHGEFKIPDHLKYGLHQLFIRHGQHCFKCRKATKPGTDEWEDAPDCPLEHLLVRDKEEAKAKTPRKRLAAIGDESGDRETEESRADEDVIHPTRKYKKRKVRREAVLATDTLGAISEEERAGLAGK